MQEFIVNVYVSLIRLRRNNYQDFALPLYPSQSCTRHNIQASLMFCTRLQRLCISQSRTRHNIQASLMFCARLQRLCTQVKSSTLNSYSYLLETI